jgi:small-conductance mechanosensitive channel
MGVGAEASGRRRLDRNEASHEETPMFSAPGALLLARAGRAKEVATCRPADEEWSTVFLAEPELWGAEDLGPDGITIRMVVKTLPSEQFKVARYLRARIKTALDEAGIEIPFPQHDIWHRSRDDRRESSQDRLQDAVALEGGR